MSLLLSQVVMGNFPFSGILVKGGVPVQVVSFVGRGARLWRHPG